MRSIGAFIGQILGALVGTFLIMRLVRKFTGETKKGTIAAFFVAWIIAWSLYAFTAMNITSREQFVQAPIMYFLALLFWLFRDISRLKNASPDVNENNNESDLHYHPNDDGNSKPLLIWSYQGLVDRLIFVCDVHPQIGLG